MKKQLLKLADKLGYSVTKKSKEKPNPYSDIKEPEFWEIYQFCSPFTMTSVERMYALYCAVNYVLSNKIPGSFAECGVWRGGSSMLVAKMLFNRNIQDRKIYLFDTFEGMSEPTTNDVDLRGASASLLLKENEESKEGWIWCVADLTDVQNNMRTTGLSEKNITYVKGKVEETVPANMPQEGIALLRLDTDWYESTKHELIHLYSKLEKGGVLLIDDYGHWEGCRKAVDEYFTENETGILLNRIDYTGRIGVKPS